MNWKDIKVADNATHFLYEENIIFNRHFVAVLKFHAPGLAPVKDQTGAYHIDVNGKDLYPERYSRTFGFYCKRAAVINGNRWFHIDEKGKRIGQNQYAWSGNFQEDICTVRDLQNNYFHIDLNGNRVYKESYKYAGDFKDGIACIKLENGNFKHIDKNGSFLNDKEFNDLGIFHKNYATAKDERGWFHIDKLGLELYKERYELIEPFYNGFALVTKFNNNKQVIDEFGTIVHLL
jgi:hypothetical protein